MRVHAATHYLVVVCVDAVQRRCPAITSAESLRCCLLTPLRSWFGRITVNGINELPFVLSMSRELSGQKVTSEIITMKKRFCLQIRRAALSIMSNDVGSCYLAYELEHSRSYPFQSRSDENCVESRWSCFHIISPHDPIQVGRPRYFKA